MGVIKKEAFKRYAEKLGYPGDSNAVFDWCDSQGAGAVSLQEIRMQLTEAGRSSSSSSRAGSKGRTKSGPTSDRSRQDSKQFRRAKSGGKDGWGQADDKSRGSGDESAADRKAKGSLTEVST